MVFVSIPHRSTYCKLYIQTFFSVFRETVISTSQLADVNILVGAEDCPIARPRAGAAALSAFISAGDRPLAASGNSPVSNLAANGNAPVGFAVVGAPKRL